MAAEKQFENRVKQYLETKGIYALGTSHTNMAVEPIGYYEKRWGGGMFTKAGLPDMHVCIKGRSIEVELKAQNGRVSALQTVMINQINRSGGKAIVLKPSDFDMFKNLIEEYIR